MGMEFTDRSDAGALAFLVRIAPFEQAEEPEEIRVERVARAVFGFMPPIGYNLRLAMARDAATAAIAALDPS